MQRPDLSIRCQNVNLIVISVLAMFGSLETVNCSSLMEKPVFVTTVAYYSVKKSSNNHGYPLVGTPATSAASSDY